MTVWSVLGGRLRSDARCPHRERERERERERGREREKRERERRERERELMSPLRWSRPAVVVALCQIFELASALDSEKRSQEMFRSTALKGLWSSTFSAVRMCSSSGVDIGIVDWGLGTGVWVLGIVNWG